jgi:Concanavalin A-like lectin/glucanases superfamily
MIPVKCPRCAHVWHSKVKPTGRDRLCADCIDDLRRKRRRRPPSVDPFWIVTAGVVFVDLVFLCMGFAGSLFRWALLGWGMMLSIPSFYVLIWYRRLSNWGVAGTGADMRLIRWPVMTGLSGAACMLVSFALGGLLAWQEKQQQQQQPPLGMDGQPLGSQWRPGSMPPPGRGRPSDEGPTPQGGGPPSSTGAPPPTDPQGRGRPSGEGATPQGAGPRQPAGVPAATDLPGLLGYWSFDDDRLAPKVADQSDRRNHATARGATWTEGIRGKALALDGRGAYLDYGNLADFNFAAGAPFTLACWLKTRTADEVVCGQRSSSDDGADISLSVERGLPCGTVRQDRATEPARVVGRRPVSDGVWHHVALTRDAGTIELFLDGAAQGQATAPGAAGPITTDLRAVGMEPRWTRQGMGTFGGVRAYFEGAVDEFCIFGRKLTAEEIRKLAGQ